MIIRTMGESLARRPAPPHIHWAGRLAALLVVVGLSAGLGLAPAAAQTAPTLALLHISLWPEFDRAGVLVILDGTLAAGTPLPAEVSLRMPAAAGQPNATAYHAADGSLLAASYTTTAAANDIIVTFSIESLDFRLEYYDPALTINGDRRTYTFDWTSDYAVTAAAVRVQQPAGASEFATLPALSATGAGEYGLQYYEGDLGALATGQAVRVTASYSKPDATLSSETVGAAAAAPAATATPAPTGAGSTTTIVWGAAGLALVAAGVVAFLIVRSQRPAAKSRRAPRRHTRNPAARRAIPAVDEPRPILRARHPPAPSAATAFCTQCGQPRQPGDQFCRQCGAPVKA